MKIYHNPRCSKSRQTLAIIEESGVAYDVVKYLDHPPTPEELSELIAKLGITPQQLLRKGEAIYKEQYKGKDLSDAEWIEAMCEHPKLIERPIVVSGDRAIIGRPPERVEELF